MVLICFLNQGLKLKGIMKKINLLLITIIMIFYFGCDNNPTVFTDCSGEENGLSIVDNCDICDEDPTNNCIQDCNTLLLKI